MVNETPTSSTSPDDLVARFEARRSSKSNDPPPEPVSVVPDSDQRLRELEATNRRLMADNAKLARLLRESVQIIDRQDQVLAQLGRELGVVPVADETLAIPDL